MFQPLHTSPLRVLFADDEEPLVVSSLELFKREGWEGEGVTSGAAVLEHLERDAFDVVVLDYTLAGSEGEQLHQRLADRHPSLPVIIITGCPSIESAIASMQRKAFDYLTKPLDMEYLLKRAREAAEQYRLRHALQHGKQRYQSLIDDVLEVSQVALLLVDAEHRIAWINRAMERFFGLQRQRVLGRDVRAFIVDELAPHLAHPAEFQRMMVAAYDNNAYPEHFECRVLESGDRKGRWLEHWSQPIVSGLYAGGRIEQYVDITTRKRAEEDLLANREHQDTAPDGSPDWEIWLGVAGELLYTSPSCQRFTGYEVQEFMDDPSLLTRIIHPDDRPALAQHYREDIVSPECARFDFRIITKDGRKRWLHHVCQPAYGTDGQPLGRHAWFQDITVRHALEEQLRKREAILEGIGFTAGQLLRDESWERSISKVLERLGAAAHVSRITIFKNHQLESGEFLMRPHASWVDPGVSGTLETPLPEGLPYRAAGLARWETVLSHGECLSGITRQFPPQERQFLMEQDIASILLVPLFAGRQWWGFIGFEESVRERVWTRTEIAALRAAADSISAAIQRELTESALRSKEAFLRGIQEVMLDAVEVIDSEGTIVWRNTLAGEIYGNSVGSKCYENLNRTVRCPDCAHTAIQYDGVPRDYECEVVDTRGRKRIMWVRATPFHGSKGGISAIVETSRDITERKRMEGALLESQRRLELALEGSGLGLWDWDVKRGRVYRDQGWNTLLGYSAETVEEHSFEPYWPAHPEDIAQAAEAWDSHLQGHTAFCEARVRMKRETGAWRWMLVRGQVVERDEDGTPVRATGTIRDITEAVLAEREQKRLSERMRQAHKLESLGILAGGVAHDFNNLLMGIMGNAHLALTSLPQSSPVRQHLTEIEHIGRRAAQLANQMLAFSGQSRFAMRPLSLSEMIRDMAPLLTACVPRRIHLRYELRDDLPVVLADDRQLRQMIIALLDNAREAIGNRAGEIRIRTTSIRADSRYLANTYVDDALAPGEYLVLELSDDGPGIPAEIVPKIFDPFFTTKLTGRGLGLAAVLGIIRGHNGAIRVDSQAGTGSKFVVLLPSTQVKPAEERAAAPAPAVEWRGQGLALLVDDEDAVLRVGEGMLKRLGFEVLKAYDGVEALEIYDRHSEAIVCVILDLTMPRMGGEEAFLQLRSRKPDLPIILSSGYSEMDVVGRFTGKRLTAFIHKPYTGDELREILRKTLTE
jgi:PAS domain S-box-containing protein